MLKHKKCLRYQINYADNHVSKIYITKSTSPNQKVCVCDYEHRKKKNDFLDLKHRTKLYGMQFVKTESLNQFKFDI